jgi:hypothetical protein
MTALAVAWAYARSRLLEPLGREPSDHEIAAFIASDPDARVIGGFGEGTTAAEILAERTPHRPPPRLQ